MRRPRPGGMLRGAHVLRLVPRERLVQVLEAQREAGLRRRTPAPDVAIGAAVTCCTLEWAAVKNNEPFLEKSSTHARVLFTERQNLELELAPGREVASSALLGVVFV